MLIQETVKQLNDLIDTVETLNHLIGTCIDRKKGFTDAAARAAAPELKAMFQRRATECGVAVDELRRLVRSFGGSPRNSGTVAGLLHRYRARLKTAFGDANVVMLGVMARTEGRAATAYGEALGVGLPPRIRRVAQLQHYGAIRNHNLIRDLHNSYKVSNEAVMSRTP